LIAMKKRPSSFVRRAVLLGCGALVLFAVLVVATYPYERAIERALSTISETSPATVTVSDTIFSFPSMVTFYDMTIVPKERPYHLLETKLPKLNAEIGLRALATRKLHARFDGEVATGDPAEGNYTVAGAATWQKTSDQGSGGSLQTHTVQLHNVQVIGADVNVTVDGIVTVSGELLNPELNLRFVVEKLGRTDSANYAVDNFLKFVKGAPGTESVPPLVFTVTGPFSRLTVREEHEEPSAEQ
jgi:hypothetical protein